MNFKIVKDASGKHLPQNWIEGMSRELKRNKTRDLVLSLLPKWIAILVLIGFVVFSSLHCTNSPNGAINYNTTKYYVDGEFVDSLINRKSNVMEFPIKDTRDYIHYYNQPVIMTHYQILVLYCRKDKQWESIRAYWNHKDSDYDYAVSRMNKQ